MRMCVCACVCVCVCVVVVVAAAVLDVKTHKEGSMHEFFFFFFNVDLEEPKTLVTFKKGVWRGQPIPHKLSTP